MATRMLIQSPTRRPHQQSLLFKPATLTICTFWTNRTSDLYFANQHPAASQLLHPQSTPVISIFWTNIQQKRNCRTWRPHHRSLPFKPASNINAIAVPAYHTNDLYFSNQHPTLVQLLHLNTTLAISIFQTSNSAAAAPKDPHWWYLFIEPATSKLPHPETYTRDLPTCKLPHFTDLPTCSHTLLRQRRVDATLFKANNTTICGIRRSTPATRLEIHRSFCS